MVYHSTINPAGHRQACGCAVLPLRIEGRGKGPAEACEGEDIIDEAINHFRANVLFRTFDVQGPSDKTLIYLTMYIQQCLKRIAGGGGLGDACKTREEGSKALGHMAGEGISLPGQAGFALGGLMSAPASAEEGELFRGYFRQCREEVGRRVLDRCFLEGGGHNKYWMAFSHRKFLNKTLA